jgi:putative transposase
MSEIIPLLMCLEPYISSTTLRQVGHVVFAMLCIPNRATMLGLSKWTEKGGSYRTLQRVYQTPMDWLQMQWVLLKTHVMGAEGVYLLAGDEVVVSKAGKKTYGVGRFYSGLHQRVIPSVSFMALSVIDVQQRQSYPLHIEQLMASKPAKKPQTAPVKRPVGRPKGSKNHVKPIPMLNSTLTVLQGMLHNVQMPIAHLGIKHVVLDGKFGNYPATWMVGEVNLHIISKMRHNAALFLPYSGDKPARGSLPRYGDKLNYSQLPPDYLISTVTDSDYRIETYQFQCYHKDYPNLLNIVVVVKIHLKTGKRGHVVLFSTDLDLTADQIVDYYSLRFQIEFNFRDAKQDWGLEDFMNISQLAVTNAANLAFFMVNLSHILLEPHRQPDPHFSVLDLKARFRARRYLSETIKMLPESPPSDLISRIWQRLSRFSAIRTRSLHDFAA